MTNEKMIYQHEVLHLLCTSTTFAQQYGSLISSEYFDTKITRMVFEVIVNHNLEYNHGLNKQQLLAEVKDLNIAGNHAKDLSNDLLEEARSIFMTDVDNEKYIISKFIEFVRYQAMKVAIIESIDILEKGNKKKNYEQVLNRIDHAIGIGYEGNEGQSFKDMDGILSIIKDKYNPKNLIKTGFKKFDKMFMGGLAGGEVHTIAAPPKCLVKNTKIDLLDGTSKTIEELYNSKEDKFWVYSSTLDGEIKPGLAHSVRITDYKTEILKVTLDNDKIIECTLDHRFMLRDGTYKEAQYLTVNDSLMPLYTRFYDYSQYLQVKNNKTEQYSSAHRHIMSELYGEDYKKQGAVCHHKDGNKLNNTPCNLELMQRKNHNKLHMKKLWNDPNHKIHEAHRQELSKRNIENWKIEEYRDKMTRILTENSHKLAQDPDCSKKCSEAGKKAWIDRDKMMEAISKRVITDERRKQMSDNMKNVCYKMNYDEEFKEYRENRKRISSETATKTNARLKNDTDHKAKMRERVYDNPECLQKQSEKAKERWENPEYRQLKTEQARQQWVDPEYKRDLIMKSGNKIIESLNNKGLEINEFNYETERKLRDSNNKKIHNGRPCWERFLFYKERKTEKPKIKKNISAIVQAQWDNPEFKRKAFLKRCNKIIQALNNQNLIVNEFNYETERAKRNENNKRIYNGIPSWNTYQTTLNNFNHKVKSIEIIKHKEPIPVYDITVDKYHNFALSAGVFVHNCGKSTLGVNMGYNALLNGHTIFHATLEISEEEVMYKYAIRATQSSYKGLMDMPQDEYIKRLQTIKKYKPNLFVKHYTEKTATTLDVRGWISQIKAVNNINMKNALIILDYDDAFLPTSAVKDNMYEESGNIYTDMIGLAKYFDAPVLTFSQPNRAGWVKAKNDDLIGSEDLSHSARKAHRATSISSMMFKSGETEGKLYIDRSRRGIDGVIIPIERDLTRALIRETKEDVSIGDTNINKANGELT